MLALSKEALARANKVDSKAIKKLLRTFLDNVADEKPSARGPPDQDDTVEEAADVLYMQDGEHQKEFTIDQIMKSADEQHTRVLEKPWYVEESSNRPRLMALHILDNIDILITQIPKRCKEFDLLPEQRLAIIAMTEPLPQETFINCTISRESMTQIARQGRGLLHHGTNRARKQPFVQKLSLEANTLPTWCVADFCTGSGKTVMAIFAALRLLCCRSSWEPLVANYQSLLRARMRDTYSGLIKLDDMEDARLARLAIMFVPGTMLNHWHQTCRSAVHGIKDIYGKQIDVLVWKGNSRDYSILEAYQCGKPVLWVKPMEADSLKDTRATPHIGYAVRIYDELNTKMSSRYEQHESTPLFNYIVRNTQSTH